MTNHLSLYIPAVSQLGYRQKLLADLATMAYNKDCHLPTPNYHNDTGCLDFFETQWQDWYRRFVTAGPDRFYAYIRRDEDNIFIGETVLRRDDIGSFYNMGVVIQHKFRNCGYGAVALDLLLKQAFEQMAIAELHNDFEVSRTAALKIHLAAGFTVVSQTGSLAHLVLTRQQYAASRKNQR